MIAVSRWMKDSATVVRVAQNTDSHGKYPISMNTTIAINEAKWYQ